MLSALRGQHFMNTNLSSFQVLQPDRTPESPVLIRLPTCDRHHNFPKSDFLIRFPPHPN